MSKSKAKAKQSLFGQILSAEDKKAEVRQVKSDVRDISRAQSEGKTFWKVVYEQRPVFELVKDWRRKRNPGLKLAVAGADKKAFKIDGVDVEVYVTGSIMIRVPREKAERLLKEGLVTEYATEQKPKSGDVSLPF